MHQWEELAQELVRAWRGRRSQRGFSTFLGYESNVVNAWESGRRYPTAATALQVARRTGVDLDTALRRFYRIPPPWLRQVDIATRDGVVLLLEDLRGTASVKDLAEQSGASRFAVSRWLRGHAEPRLPEFLALVDAASARRLLHLVAFLADPRRLPSIRDAWETTASRLTLIDREPWAQVVFAALTLASYRQLPAHDDAWIGAQLGIDAPLVARCIDALIHSGQIRQTGAHWESVQTIGQDTVSDPDAARRMKAFWARVALDRLEAGSTDFFSFNVFTASEADYVRLRELHVEYYRAVWAVVAGSVGPSERVVVANTQLFSLR